MRLLAIDCATEACSVALFEGDDLLGYRHAVLGRGHAERLVPMIAELPGRGEAAEIRVGLGPGSFTGTRIGLAAARALGIAWGARVLGFPTLALVAALARSEGAEEVTVCMTGGHGEWFVQDFGTNGIPDGDYLSLKPEAAAAREVRAHIAGSKAQALADLLDAPAVRPLDLLPDARLVPALPQALLTDRLAPIYGRPPDARPAQ